MKMTYKQVLEAALTLGKNDRRKLREQLNVNLDPKPKVIEEEDEDDERIITADWTEEEIGAEIHRRAEEMERDPSACIPWEQVKARLDRELKNGSHSAPARRRRVRQGV